MECRHRNLVQELGGMVIQCDDCGDILSVNGELEDERRLGAGCLIALVLGLLIWVLIGLLVLVL